MMTEQMKHTDAIFKQFDTAYSPDNWAIGPDLGWSHSETQKLIGTSLKSFTEFMSTKARSSYNQGLIRFLQSQTTPSIWQWNSNGYWSSEWFVWKGPYLVFAYDWLGRQIAFDLSRIENGEPMISAFIPGTGEAVEASEGFLGFLQTAIIENQELFSASYLKAWLAAGGAAPGFDECVGYKIPLFAGGKDEIDNMEIINLDVYMTMLGQLYQAVS